jgi:hypothetical protein
MQIRQSVTNSNTHTPERYLLQKQTGQLPISGEASGDHGGASSPVRYLTDKKSKMAGWAQELITKRGQESAKRANRQAGQPVRTAPSMVEHFGNPTLHRQKMTTDVHSGRTMISTFKPTAFMTESGQVVNLLNCTMGFENRELNLEYFIHDYDDAGESHRAPAENDDLSSGDALHNLTHAGTKFSTRAFAEKLMMNTFNSVGQAKGYRYDGPIEHFDLAQEIVETINKKFQKQGMSSPIYSDAMGYFKVRAAGVKSVEVKNVIQQARNSALSSSHGTMDRQNFMKKREVKAEEKAELKCQIYRDTQSRKK